MLHSNKNSLDYEVHFVGQPFVRLHFTFNLMYHHQTLKADSTHKKFFYCKKVSLSHKMFCGFCALLFTYKTSHCLMRERDFEVFLRVCNKAKAKAQWVKGTVQVNWKLLTFLRLLTLGNWKDRRNLWTWKFKFEMYQNCINKSAPKIEANVISKLPRWGQTKSFFRFPFPWVIHLLCIWCATSLISNYKVLEWPFFHADENAFPHMCFESSTK